MRIFIALCLLSLGIVWAQSTPRVEVVPVDQEPAHKLVFENEYVRVFKVEVAPHSETKYHQHDRDYVGVILGDADVESVRLGGASVKLQQKDGEVHFTDGGFAHKAINKSDKPFKNVTVELKQPVGPQIKILDDSVGYDARAFATKDLFKYEHLTARLTWNMSGWGWGMFPDSKKLIIAITQVKPGGFITGAVKESDCVHLRMQPGDVKTDLPDTWGCPMEKGAKFVVLDFK